MARRRRTYRRKRGGAGESGSEPPVAIASSRRPFSSRVRKGFEKTFRRSARHENIVQAINMEDIPHTGEGQTPLRATPVTAFVKAEKLSREQKRQEAFDSIKTKIEEYDRVRNGENKPLSYISAVSLIREMISFFEKYYPKYERAGVLSFNINNDVPNTKEFSNKLKKLRENDKIAATKLFNELRVYWDRMFTH